MTEHILKAHMLNPDDPRYKVNAHEITPGIVYKDDNVTVKAFPVAHGDDGGVRVPIRNTRTARS